MIGSTQRGSSELSQTYRLSPELRRCAWYGLITALVVPTVALLLNPNRPPDPLGIVIGTLLVCGMVLAMVVPLTWQLTADSAGFTRRIGPWRDEWRWSEFESGLVEKLPGRLLFHRKKRWLLARLHYGYLSDKDILRFVDQVNRHYSVSPQQPLPDSSTIKVSFSRIEFSPSGIAVDRFRKPKRSYAWDAVEIALVTREDSRRDDFRSLQIRLPDDEISLRTVRVNGSEQAAWNGASSRDINNWLVHYLPPDRFDVAIVGEPNCSAAHQDLRLANCRAKLRELRWLIGFVSASLIALWGFMAIAGGWPKATLLVGMQALIFGAALLSMYSNEQEKLRRLTDVTNN